MKKITKILIGILAVVLLSFLGFAIDKQYHNSIVGSRTDSGITIWGDIIGDIAEQTDITTYIASSLVPRIGSLTSSTTLTIDSDLYDQFYITGLEATTTIAVSGTPTQGQKLILGITASTTAQGLTFSTSSFATSSDLDFPAATTANKTMYLEFIWNSVKSKWILLALINNI